MKVTIQPLKAGGKAVVISAETTLDEDKLLRFKDVQEIVVDQSTTVGLVFPLSAVPEEVCPRCSGWGQIPVYQGAWARCLVCNGYGTYVPHSMEKRD